MRWRARCALQQLTFSQRSADTTATPQPGFVELPERLARVLLSLSTASERLLRLIELRAHLRDGTPQEFELGALLVAQFDAPIPSLVGLSHRPVFGVRRRAPARRAPALPCRMSKSSKARFPATSSPAIGFPGSRPSDGRRMVDEPEIPAESRGPGLSPFLA
jgi:hypothetical protein